LRPNAGSSRPNVTSLRPNGWSGRPNGGWLRSNAGPSGRLGGGQVSRRRGEPQRAPRSRRGRDRRGLVVRLGVCCSNAGRGLE